MPSLNRGMIDALLGHLDLRQIVESELGRPRSKGSAAWTWPCPLHNETHGAALAVWRNGWHCFGACGAGGDAIDWRMRRNNIDFKEALHVLGWNGDIRDLPKPPVPPLAPATKEPPSEEWQNVMRGFLLECAANLKTNAGALEYLRTGRGLWPDTLKAHRLGFNPSWRTLPLYHDGKLVRIAPGITIPVVTGRQIWAVRIRTTTGALAQVLNKPEQTFEHNGKTEKLPKYLSVKGSSTGGLFNLDQAISTLPLFITEGEFNALALAQEAGDLVNPVSLGSASAALNPRWAANLVVFPRILAYFDQDDAGGRGRERLAGVVGGVQFVQLPGSFKDINDFALAAAAAKKLSAVWDWVKSL